MKMNKTVKIEDGEYTDTWKKIQLLPENDMGPFCFGTGFVLRLQALFSSLFPRLITIHSSRSSPNSTTPPQQAINALLSVASVHITCGERFPVQIPRLESCHCPSTQVPPRSPTCTTGAPVPTATAGWSWWSTTLLWAPPFSHS